MNEFNLKQIFNEVFGYSPPVQEPFKVNAKDLLNDKNTDSKYGPYYAKDLVGREIFMPLTLGSGQDSLFLPYTWISVKFDRTIVETQLTERRSSVKEQIRNQDYQFSVKGLFVGQNGRFPEEDLEKWKTLIEIDKTLDIKCPLTDIFLLTPERGGHDKVLILSAYLNDNPGVKHVRGFTMELKSDEPFTLEVA